jgi:hypothetical protein
VENRKLSQLRTRELAERAIIFADRGPRLAPSSWRCRTGRSGEASKGSRSRSGLSTGAALHWPWIGVNP